MINIEIPKFDIVVPVDRVNEIKRKPGLYIFHSDSDEILYVGKATNLLTRVRQHITGNSDIWDVSPNFKIVKCFYCECPVERDIYETYLINELRPPINRSKTFLYQSSYDDPRFYGKEYFEMLAERYPEVFEELMEELRSKRNS